MNSSPSVATIITLESAQSRLLESEAFLERVEMVSGVGGFMIDLRTQIPRWTRQSYRIHDLDADVSPPTLGGDAFYSPEARGQMSEALRIARESGQGFDIEIPIVTAKGRPIWIRVAGEVERDGGAPVRVVGAFQDVTERRILEQRLRDGTAKAEAANSSKSQFLANMSHEIRTPLNAVIGLGYLLDQTTLSADQHQLLAKIQLAGRALLGIVNNVLDLSKVEAGELALEDEPFDLPELVRDLSQMLGTQATAKGIELLMQPAATLPRLIRGDESRLRQILVNLLSNAIKFTRVGRVALRVFCTEQCATSVRLRCEVTDSGIGIEAAALQRLFTPFTQADASTTRRFGGTGLGLSISRHYVELMGGEIGVDSIIAVGSTFWIEAPFQLAVVGVEVVEADFDDANAQLLTGVRILVVDDSDVNLEVAQRILEKHGASVSVCSDSGNALQRVRAQPQEFDLILMDVQMPDLDGNEVTRLMRADPALRLLPIIALTAGALVGERQRALDAGMNDFVSKPFDPRVLVRKVRRLVEQSRGTPIPVVAGNGKLPRRVATGPLMPSVDAGIVRQMFDDDTALFNSVVVRVLKEYVDLTGPVCLAAAATAPVRKRLEHRVHKLRGSAGMIGATAIVRLAAAAEATLQSNGPIDVINGIMGEVAAALLALRDEALPLMEQQARQTANPDSESAQCTPISGAELAEFCTLLESQNLAALDSFGLLSHSLRTALGATSFARLRDAIDDLDFQLAATVIRQARPA